MRQENFNTGMYIVDRNYRIINCNDAMRELYPDVQPGDICYKAVALRDHPCEICPLLSDNSLFYNPIRKEWIYANAAAMPDPVHGECYHVQFQLRQRVGDVGQEALQSENMEEHIKELSGGNPDACAIGGYCEPGSPLSYASESLLRLLGYDDLSEMLIDIDGLVSNTIHPDDMERVTRDLTRAAQHGGTFETTYRMRRKDHSWFWIVNRGKRVETHDGAFVLFCVISDMSEFIQRQSSLRKQNETLLQKELTSRALLEHMPGGYHRCANAPGFPFLYFGASFEAITGWTRKEIETDFDNLFANMVLPEDMPLCAGIITNVEKYGYSNAIYRMKKKGGGHIWVSDSTMRVDVGDESYYHGVLADVSEQIEAMEKAMREAEASSLAKSTFLFNASHDIRTPMNAIQGFAHIIEKNARCPELVLENVRKLKQSGEILMTLLNDVLELSRIERGKEIIHNQPLDMFEHVNRLHEMMLQSMSQSGIHFRMENDIRHPRIIGDELKLTRIAMNLLSNAKKFTPAGGTVTFGVRETDFDGQRATYRLFVRDTGIGMSEEFQQRAFEQFERERSSTDSGISGSGLGLAIIKKIVDLLGGECSIVSALGKGTEITCSITMEIDKKENLPQPLSADDVNFTGMSLLLVEDNDFNREIARYVFEDVGFRVDEAENGLVCLEKIRNSDPDTYDFILMDIQMPLMDGYAATQAIRALDDSRRAGIPIIAMTANAFEEDRKRCLDVGMDGHISKPLDAKSVLKELTQVLTKQGECR